jgi:hypothetical protein
VLACVRCLTGITTTAARIEVNGAHAHTFANPHGFVYHVGCFLEAPGCRAQGAATAYWSWFPGHTWRLAHCAACGEHLGWLFEGPDSVFHGLVLDRLAERED